MNIFLYNKGFKGFLSVIFELYKKKLAPGKIIPEDKYVSGLFQENIYRISADENKSERVWKALCKILSTTARRWIYVSFISGLPEVEMHIFQYIKKVFDKNQTIESNYRDPHVLFIKKAYFKVTKEASRMISFVRFQKTKDDIYYASISPAYDVLPLISPHFQGRFADQKWLIFDIRRQYGHFYDLKQTREVRFDNVNINKHNGFIHKDIAAQNEAFFVELWKKYYKATTIQARKNRKLHLQFMPLRYRAFLPETYQNN